MEYLNDRGTWCRVRFLVAERDADGKAIHVLWLIESIDEEKKRRDRLKSLSKTGPMTGVRNKHASALLGLMLLQESLYRRFWEPRDPSYAA